MEVLDSMSTLKHKFSDTRFSSGQTDVAETVSEARLWTETNLNTRDDDTHTYITYINTH